MRALGAQINGIALSMRQFLLLLFVALFSGTVLANVSLSDSEQRWLNQGHKVRVAVFDDNYPYIFRNSNGEYEGIVKDYLRYIERFSDIDFEEVLVDSPEQAYVELQKGNIDLSPMGVAMKNSPFAYTTPYLPYHYFISLPEG